MIEVKKCKSCGNNLQFNPETQGLRCVYCDSQETFDVNNYSREKSRIDLNSANEIINAENYRCPNCGASDTFDNKSVSLVCKYCGTPIVLDTFEKDINAIVPFKISEKNAKVCFNNWIRKRIWAPRSLKKLARLGNFKGHYMPAFSFDNKVSTSYTGVRVVTESVGMGDNRRTVEHRYPFSGSRKDDFTDVIVAGNDFISNGLLEQLEPFDYTTLKIYSNEFLFGFIVDNYTISAPIAYKTAKYEMERSIENNITRQHAHGGRVENIKMSCIYIDGKQARYLLPIWSSSYEYKRKNYNFYINGCTGEVHGKAPVSKWKVFFAVLFGIALVSGFIYLTMGSQCSSMIYFF